MINTNKIKIQLTNEEKPICCSPLEITGPNVAGRTVKITPVMRRPESTVSLELQFLQFQTEYVDLNATLLKYSKNEYLYPQFGQVLLFIISNF